MKSKTEKQQNQKRNSVGGRKGRCKVCEDKKADYIRRTYADGGFRILQEEGFKITRTTLDKCIKNHRPEELGLSNVAEINSATSNVAEIITPTDSAQIIIAPTIADLKKEKELVYSKVASLVTKEGFNDKLIEYTERIENLLTLCEKTKQIHHFTALSHVLAKLLELSGKAAGVFAPDTAIQINNFIDSDDYKKLKQLIIQTLLPYPEALAAVGEAIKNSGL